MGRLHVIHMFTDWKVSLCLHCQFTSGNIISSSPLSAFIFMLKADDKVISTINKYIYMCLKLFDVHTKCHTSHKCQQAIKERMLTSSFVSLLIGDTSSVYKYQRKKTIIKTVIGKKCANVCF